MVGSGVVKLASGDPTWHNLTALSFHFETQPIPTPLAWYAHRSPMWLLKLSTALVFTIEIGAPYLILAGRRLRHACVCASHRSAAPHRAHRQLRILQPAERVALCLPSRRRDAWLMDATRDFRDGRDPGAANSQRCSRDRHRPVVGDGICRIARNCSSDRASRESGDGHGGIFPQRERLRPVRRDDNDAARDRPRRIGRWDDVARV